MKSGDKLLHIMKEEGIGIAELSVKTKIPEPVILEILAGIREADVTMMCRLAAGLGICIQELQEEEETYFVQVPKETLAKLLVLSMLEEREVEELVFQMFEQEILKHGF